MLPLLLLNLAIISLAFLLGATAYESAIMAPNFQRDPPRSLQIARDFLQRPTPAAFFRPLAPLAQLLLLASVVACWNHSALRGPALIALGFMIVTDAITFRYHYPRLKLMFQEPAIDDAAVVGKAAREWAAGNFVRLGLILIAFLAILHALALARVVLAT